MSEGRAGLEVRDLRVEYGQLEVLHGVSLSVGDGEFVTVLGTNGAGKSTLLRAAAGAMTWRSGTVTFGDVDVARTSAHKVVRLGIGYAMERGRIFQRQTVESNLEIGAYPLGRAGRSPRAGRSRRADLFERVYDLFPVLKRKAKLMAGTMSGGERQMLAIGQALMSDPKLLVLDEPSAGLAPLLVSEVFSALSRLRAEGLSLLLAEQTVDQALVLCDRGYVLEAGQIVLSGPAEELRRNDAVREVYIGVLGQSREAGVPMTVPPLQISVNPMAAYDLGLAEEVQVLTAVGVERIGLAAQKLVDHGWEAGLRAVAGAGLQVAYLVHGIFSAVDDDAGWARESALMARTIDTAAELGAGFVYFCTGPPGNLRWEEAADRLGERLAPARERASAAGVGLAVENGMSIWSQCTFAFSLRDTLTLATRIGTGICVDVYSCWIEAGLTDTLAAAADRTLLVQLSDRELTSLSEPDRRVLGDGDLPLERLLDDVLDAGYRGLLDIELFGPRIDAEGPVPALRRSVTWLEGALSRATARANARATSGRGVGRLPS